MENKPQKWFEMPEIRKRFHDKSSWIPLKESRSLLKDGEHGYAGYIEEYFGIGSIAVPISEKKEAEKLGWMEIGTRGSTTGYVEEGK